MNFDERVAAVKTMLQRRGGALDLEALAVITELRKTVRPDEALVMQVDQLEAQLNDKQYELDQWKGRAQSAEYAVDQLKEMFAKQMPAPPLPQGLYYGSGGGVSPEHTPRTATTGGYWVGTTTVGTGTLAPAAQKWKAVIDASQQIRAAAAQANAEYKAKNEELKQQLKAAMVKVFIENPELKP